MPNLRISLALLSFCALAPSYGNAQTKPNATATTSQRLYDEANSERNLKHWDGCRASAMAAWGASKTPQIAMLLGVCELELKRFRDAAEHFSIYLDRSTGINESDRHQVEVWRAECLKHVTTLQIRSNVPDVTVKIDNEVVGTTPLTAYLTPGTHELEGHSIAYEPTSQLLDCNAGDSKEIRLDLKDLSPSLPVSSTPRAAPSVPAPKRPSLAPAVVGGALAGFALGGGIIFTLIANGKSKSIQSKSESTLAAHGPRACDRPGLSECDDLQSLGSSRATFSGLAVGSFVGAGIVAAGSVVYTALSLRSSSSSNVGSTVSFAGGIGPYGGALNINGTW